jgi:hypothetical protein
LKLAKKSTDRQTLLAVEISPMLPSELAPHDSPISRLLLGLVNAASKLSDIEHGVLVIEIYIPQLNAINDVYDPKDLRKIGVGCIFASSKAALDWNWRNKLM